MSYAENTKVPVARSEAELKSILRKHGADRIATGMDAGAGLAIVNFELSKRLVRLQVQVPTAEAFTREAEAEPPRGWKGWKPSQRQAWARAQQDQVERQRWRSLVLLTKAKLEAIEQGSSTVEREFLADLVLPGGGGNTLHQLLSGRIDETYATGKMPPLLPGMGKSR